MTTRIRKFALGTALAAMTLGSVTPAMAQSYPYGGYRNHDRGDTTGAAVIGGIVGIALGALIASGGNKDRNRYRNRGWSYRDGYYWDRQGRRYDRDGQPCDDDRGGGDYYQGDGYRGNDGYRDGYRGNDGYRGDDGYYNRRGYRGY
jgi:hypothetical protein